MWIAMMIGCLPGCSEPGPLPSGDASAPDVILVSIDTLRADHLSSYGYERQTSPFLDSLAADGVRFAQARSASPWTLPAHTTMLTGQLPATHRVVDDSLSLSETVPYLPDVMAQAGYHTGGFVTTLYVSRMFGFQRGFEHFDDFGIETEKENLRGETLAEDVIDRALAWWSGQPAEEPVFLFLHFYDVHYTYDPPAPYDTMFDRAPESGDQKYKNYFHFLKNPVDDIQMTHQVAQYDESIRYVDAQLKRLADAAAAAGRSVRWVVTSDHGEEFGERGSWGHAHTLYAEQLHIPLIVSGPGIPGGTVIEEWVGNHDIAPTIAGWVNGTLAADGINLAPAMEGAPVPSRAFLAETTRFKTNRLSLLEGGLRLEWDLKADRIELFEPATDPKEAADLSAARPKDVAALASRAIELLGADWEASRSGMVRPERAVILSDKGRTKKRSVQAGDQFAVLPYDAPVRFVEGDEKHGPWQAAGGAAPGEGDPLMLLRTAGTSGVTMDDADRAMLEALGYITTDEPAPTLPDCGEGTGEAGTDCVEKSAPPLE
ncbi:MAG: sulfatase [Myxococcota bacterium]|nr:sulfatase [Myxococcota bacterium]